MRRSWFWRLVLVYYVPSYLHSFYLCSGDYMTELLRYCILRPNISFIWFFQLFLLFPFRLHLVVDEAGNCGCVGSDGVSKDGKVSCSVEFYCPCVI